MTPQIEIMLAAGETATLTVRDNGQGIEDLDALFEPFYTTKQPGDGVGLGACHFLGHRKRPRGTADCAQRAERGGCI